MLHEKLTYGGMSFEVLAMEEHRISKVKVVVNSEEQGQEGR